jgi:hypothetical protein
MVVHLMHCCLQMVKHLFVLSASAVLILDQRTLAIKYRLPIDELDKVSLSPYSDDLVVFHVKKVILIFIHFWQKYQRLSSLYVEIVV